jgi:ankyrin repeat protein
LLGHGAEVDAMSRKGHTALHRAAARGRKRIVELLLGAGADVELKDKWCRTAIDAAVKENREEIAGLLRSRIGASVGS